MDLQLERCGCGVLAAKEKQWELLGRLGKQGVDDIEDLLLLALGQLGDLLEPLFELRGWTSLLRLLGLDAEELLDRNAESFG